MKYKFHNPLKMVTNDTPVFIEEMDIDLESLTLKDMQEVEFEYFNDSKSNNIPSMTKHISIRWFSKLILVLLKKQYPHIFFVDNDVNKISWHDARELVLTLEGEYLYALQDRQVRILEQLELAQKYKKEEEKDDTVSEKAD